MSAQVTSNPVSQHLPTVHGGCLCRVFFRFWGGALALWQDITTAIYLHLSGSGVMKVDGAIFTR